MKVTIERIIVCFILTQLFHSLTFNIKRQRNCVFGPEIWISSRRQGPKKTASYNPNYGYEPYWVGGDWVFDILESTTEKGTLICGKRCPDVYIEFGEVCGRSLNYTHKTFKNYCELFNEDCSGKDPPKDCKRVADPTSDTLQKLRPPYYRDTAFEQGYLAVIVYKVEYFPSWVAPDLEQEWLIAYRGKCQGDLKTYPTKHAELVTRAEMYIHNFEESNPPKHKKPHKG